MASLSPRVRKQGGSDDLPRKTEAPIEDSNKRVLNFVHSGLLFSHFLQVDRDGQDCTTARSAESECFGGAAKIKSQLLAQQPAMTLFSGDVYQGHIWFRIRKEQVVVQMMNQLSFDAMSLGISEFYNGPRGLTPLFANLTKETRLVLCNADFSNDPHLNELPNTPQRSFEKVMAGVRVGVIGYIHEEVRVHGQPGPTITFTNPRDCLQEEARKLRSKGVSVVIALGGGNPDLDRHLAENVTEVDAFVVSYKDRFAYPSTQENLLRKAPDLDYPIKVDRANGTGYIFVATNHYQFLGRFTITVRWRDRKVLSASGRPELLDKYSAEDADTTALMNAIRDAIEPEAETVIGTTKVLIENHVSKCSAEECNGGNMFADAVFDHFSDPPVSGVWSQINAVVVNAGSFVKSFDERVNGGEVRLVDLFDMYPYDNPYVLVTMQGDTLRAMMEHSINTDVGHADKFLQISGMRVQYDRNADVGSRVKQLSILCTACRTPSYQRVIKIQWYTVAMPRFIAGGGGGYDFSRVPRGYKIDSNITDGHILQKYLKKHSPLMPMLDGRITFTSGAPESPAALWDLGRAACVRLLLLFGGVYCSMLKH